GLHSLKDQSSHRRPDFIRFFAGRQTGRQFELVGGFPDTLDQTVDGALGTDYHRPDRDMEPAPVDRSVLRLGRPLACRPPPRHRRRKVVTPEGVAVEIIPGAVNSARQYMTNDGTGLVETSKPERDGVAIVRPASKSWAFLLCNAAMLKRATLAAGSAPAAEPAGRPARLARSRRSRPVPTAGRISRPAGLRLRSRPARGRRESAGGSRTRQMHCRTCISRACPGARTSSGTPPKRQSSFRRRSAPPTG